MKRQNNTVLWWAAAGFALMLGAWAALFIAASHHRVREVPLATGEQEKAAP